MAPRTKNDLDKMGRELETAELIYQDALLELKEAMDEVPQDRNKIRTRIPNFQEEYNSYSELCKAYQDLYTSVNGSDDAQKAKVRSNAKKLREARELISLAKIFSGVEDDDNSSVVTARSHVTVTGDAKNRRKLPKLSLPQFSGEVRDWLAFWSQFEEIDKDASIPSIDKFQYLLQSMKEDSLAEKIVKSYPVSSKNYQLAVDSLKERYGRESVLVKVYVRDLLKLVIGNANQEVTDFASLFVQLSSQLRALGTLGVTTDKCASVIYPLVECCLPEEILRAWQRDPCYGTADTSDKELEQLIEFLKREVRGEDNIRLACGGLCGDKDHHGDKKSKGSFSKRNTSGPSTAAVLLTTGSSQDSKKNQCVFCGNNHTSITCRKAATMTNEERKKILKEKNCCFICVKEGHSAKKCRSSVQCLNCSGRHETVLCNNLARNKTDKQKDESKSDSTAKEDSTGTTTSMSNVVRKNTQVFLKTLVIYVQGKSKCFRVRAVIDDGSHKSYILKRLAEKLNLEPVGHENVIHSLFGGTQTKVQRHATYMLHVSDLEDNYTCEFKVSDSSQISGSINCYRSGPWTKELEKHGITLSDVDTNDDPIDVLLGADVAGILMTGKMIKLNCGPVAIQTKLGWTLLGETQQVINSSIKNMNFREEQNSFLSVTMLNPEVVETLTSLHVADDSVEKLWRLDSLGINDPSEQIEKEAQDAQAMEYFKKTVKIDKEDRVEVTLPKISGHRALPSYRWIAEKKLQITTKKLKIDGKLEEYHQLLKLWEDMGIIEEVPTEQLEGPAHYLQHRAVYNPNSTTTPTRPVFNASYKKTGEPSLNECLEKGPNLLELIPVILTRFRLEQVGVLADIAKAFQQISVAEEDRDLCRFLWWKDLNLKEVKVYRHRRVVFGINSSPFLLAASLQFVLDRVPDEKKMLAEKLAKSLYVDNLVVSVKSMEEAEHFKKESCEMLSTAKFELRGWEVGPVKEEKVTSLLGLKWNMKQDTIFSCASSKLVDIEEPITRRKILSVANSVFDPLGFTIPFMLNFKRLVQETWTAGETKIGWDTSVGDAEKERFIKLYVQLEDLSDIQIPRWITSSSTDRSKWSLHVFVDGSKISYAAAAFLRIEGEDTTSVHLLQARSRVTPLKELTIPRVELLSCFIGARLATFVKESLEFTEIPTYFWTDSSTALHWIVNDGDWGVFVRNRVEHILQHSARSAWRHIPGEHNPADLPSRGCSVKQLVESRWWEGPSWLSMSPDLWPKSKVIVNEKEINCERKKTFVSSLNQLKEEEKIYQELCKLQDYDEMMQHMETHLGGTKSKEEVEDRMLAIVQQVHFNNKDDVRLKKLDVIRNEGQPIRLKTRLFYGSFDEKFRCPIILPANCPVVHALIMKIHLENSHGGRNFLMSKLREKYWIFRSKKTIRSIIGKCKSCQRFDARAVKVNTPPLPKERIEAETPFEITGVDLFGPMFLKDGRKVWVCLFTCAVYRAVHLELVTSLSTSQFKMALRRFVSRRGKPKMIFSDNGTNFTGCSNEMKTVDWKKIETSTDGQGIQWRFIPPAAPWWGGWWERLVGIVKDLLRRTIGQSTLNQLELITILTEVEGIVNQRPLTYVSEDPEDLIPITPSMFLVGEKSSQLPELNQIDSKGINKRLQYMQRLREDLRTRFRQEYLGQLNNVKQGKESPGIKVGDVVLVQCDNKKRLDWPLGKVMDLTPGRDGKIRVVCVRTNHGELKRPIQRIFPLEVQIEGQREGSQFKIPKELTMLDISSVTTYQ